MIFQETVVLAYVTVFPILFIDVTETVAASATVDIRIAINTNKIKKDLCSLKLSCAVFALKKL
jgi:hypothetical protein